MVAAKVHLWHLWPGRHWPLTYAEEATFVAELSALATGLRPHATRSDMTAVLNALRCGMCVEELLGAAPGLRPERLLVAYQELDRRRQAAVAAWSAIVDHPTIGALAEHAPLAARALPIPVHRIIAASAYERPAMLGEDIARSEAMVARIGAAALALEQRLATMHPDDVVDAARELYDPYYPGLWGHPFYLPTRVGALVPVRVRELLGEHHQ